jgi:hypothetical protein
VSWEAGGSQGASQAGSHGAGIIGIQARSRYHEVSRPSTASQIVFTVSCVVRTNLSFFRKLFHPNIILFMGSCSSVKGQLKIITELMYTDMEKLLKSNRNLTLNHRMKMAKGEIFINSSSLGALSLCV